MSMTFCERVAIKLWIDGFPMDQIRQVYKNIPSPAYDFNQPETHIKNYLKKKVQDVKPN